MQRESGGNTADGNGAKKPPSNSRKATGRFTRQSADVDEGPMHGKAVSQRQQSEAETALTKRVEEVENALKEFVRQTAHKEESKGSSEEELRRMKEEMEERRVQDRDEYTKELEKERKEFETYKNETKEQMQKHNEETEQKLREFSEELSRTNGRVAESTVEAKHDTAILLAYVDGVVANFRRLKDRVDGASPALGKKRMT